MSQDACYQILKESGKSMTAKQVAECIDNHPRTTQHDLYHLSKAKRIECWRPRMWGRNSHHVYYIRRQEK